ncbi:MAG: hypothetical protein U9N51_03795, partial [Bacteroidota bacterium]|nr:hypothetical protein [Bacteroidota bacterium]
KYHRFHRWLFMLKLVRLSSLHRLQTSCTRLDPEAGRICITMGETRGVTTSQTSAFGTDLSTDGKVNKIQPLQASCTRLDPEAGRIYITMGETRGVTTSQTSAFGTDLSTDGKVNKIQPLQASCTKLDPEAGRIYITMGETRGVTTSQTSAFGADFAAKHAKSVTKTKPKPLNPMSKPLEAPVPTAVR